MKQTIIITGASGRLGQACVQAFERAAWQVIPHSLAPTKSGQLGDLPAHADVLLHAANPSYTQWHTQAMPALEQSIGICRRVGATLMLPGNVYNYQPLGLQLDESAVQHSATRKGQLRIAMEQRLAAEAEHGLRSVVLRAGDFFGAGRGSWFDLALASRLRKGQFVYPGAMDAVHAWAYLPDLAQTFVALAQRRAQLPALETLHFAGHSLTGQDWLAAMQAIAQAQGWVKPGQALKRGNLPWGLMRLMSPMVPIWREVLEMRYLWDEPHTLSDQRLQAALGQVQHTPLAQALTTSLVGLGLLVASHK
jgi:nucleoside-diphosphate-sugar epimerase